MWLNGLVSPRSQYHSMFRLYTEYVYANYMQYWGSVQLLDKEISQEIARTIGLKLARLSSGFSLAYFF